MTEQATQWTRETPWRQGSVLRADTATTFGLVNPEDSQNTCVVVISHDCDLANDNLRAEPQVEVIVGRVVAKEDNNFLHGKVARKLHLPMLLDGRSTFIELAAPAKTTLPKMALAAHAPNASFSIDAKNLSVLRAWLGARYRRSVFADEFNNRMKSTRLAEKLTSLARQYGEVVSVVGFTVDGGKIVERDAEDSYELKVTFIHIPGDDAEATLDRMDELVKKFQDAAAECLKDGKQIRLKSCVAISEDDLRVSRARQLSEWDLEYLSMRDEKQVPRP